MCSYNDILSGILSLLMIKLRKLNVSQIYEQRTTFRGNVIFLKGACLSTYFIYFHLVQMITLTFFMLTWFNLSVLYTSFANTVALWMAMSVCWCH